MSMAMAATPKRTPLTPGYVSVSEASRRSKMNKVRVFALALSGRVRYLVEAGEYPRVSLEDVMKISRREFVYGRDARIAGEDQC